MASNTDPSIGQPDNTLFRLLFMTMNLQLAVC